MLSPHYNLWCVRISAKIGLTELILRSEKREDLLIFLKDGPKSIDEIRHLHVNSVYILLAQKTEG